MLKLNLTMFGGRGANSGYGDKGINNGGDNRPLRFYDKTNIYKGMTVQEFENATRNKKVEYIGLYNDENKIIIAGTSGNEGKVAIPTSHPDFNKINSFTHNHPNNGNRQLGGSFSGADINAATLLNLKSTRANAFEKTYIFKKTGANKSQRKMMMARSVYSDSTWDKNANARVKKIKAQFKKQGKKMSTALENKIYFGYGTRLWKDYTKGSGYTYTEIKSRYRK